EARQRRVPARVVVRDAAADDEPRRGEERPVLEDEALRQDGPRMHLGARDRVPDRHDLELDGIARAQARTLLAGDLELVGDRMRAVDLGERIAEDAPRP